MDNAHAIALYEQFGFERLVVRKRYYQPEDKDAWTMRMDLAAEPQKGSTAPGDAA